jgi:hypothetical protein
VCNTSKCRNIAYQANQCCSRLRVLLRLSRVKCSHSRVLIVTPDQSIATRCDDYVDLAINHIAVVYLKVLPPNQPNSKTKRKTKTQKQKTEKRCEHKRSLRETQANAVCLHTVIPNNQCQQFPQTQKSHSTRNTTSRNCFAANTQQHIKSPAYKQKPLRCSS